MEVENKEGFSRRPQRDDLKEASGNSGSVRGESCVTNYSLAERGSHGTLPRYLAFATCHAGLLFTAITQPLPGLHGMDKDSYLDMCTQYRHNMTCYLTILHLEKVKTKYDFSTTA